MFTAETKCPFFKLPNFEQWYFIHLHLISFEETRQYKLSKLDEKRNILTLTCVEVQNFE